MRRYASRAKTLYRSFSRDETAQDLVEYVLLAALISAGVIVIVWGHILSSSAQLAVLILAKQLLMILAT